MSDVWQQLLQEFRQNLTQVRGKPKQLEQLRHTYLGKKGQLRQLFQQQLTRSQDKKKLGQQFNRTKEKLQQLLNQAVHRQESDNNWQDITVPGRPPLLGHRHPITWAIDRIVYIFRQLGFEQVRYPEVDWDYYVFESLNMPPDHPARDEWETFFVDAPPDQKLGQMVLTTHTSNAQVREMLRVKTPPLRMLNIGRCYRRQQDLTHTQMFHQFEGLVIDQQVSIAHLKGTLDYFARKFYGPQAKSRLRPYMFRFTEPSFEVDFSCVHCQGTGCRFCKSGWHEVGGAGMVHPHVLKAGGIDSDKYSGFAFGWGIERLISLIPGTKINDIRTFYQNDCHLLSQF